MGHTAPTFPTRGLSLRAARRQLLTASTVAPTKPSTFLARAEHSALESAAALGQPRPSEAPPRPPTHQFPQSFCSTVPGGKKLPPDSQGQDVGSTQTPPEVRGEVGLRAKGQAALCPPCHYGLEAPSPSQCPSPLPTLSLHTMQQSPLGAEAALHTGDGLAMPPGFRTMVMAGGGTRGATGLIHLAPFTLQS